MRMINECLEMTYAKRAEIDAYDHDLRNRERKAMIEERKELRSKFGNRKERRAEQSRRRKEFAR